MKLFSTRNTYVHTYTKVTRNNQAEDLKLLHVLFYNDSSTQHSNLTQQVDQTTTSPIDQH